MILEHIMGLPVEESVLQLAPVGAAVATAATVAARARLGSLRRWLGREFRGRARGPQ